MAKKYHGSAKRDMGRDGDMERSHSSRMRPMHEGGGMIKDDMSKFCNLPTEVMDKEFGKGEYSMPGRIRDLYEGAEQQMSQDERELRRITRPTKA
jgi:hypothetical protein